MQLDKEFINSLTIPFDAVLPHGAYAEIQRQNKLSQTVPAKVLSGRWTNEDIVRQGLRIIISENNAMDNFLRQFPPTLIAEIKEEIKEPQTA